MTDWTLETELKKQARTESLTEALMQLKLLSENERFQSIQIDREWQRGGAETFNLIFSILTSRRLASFMIKACVPFSPAIGIDLVVEKWCKRRQILSDHGVSVPTLYASGFGVIIEDLIPTQLVDLDQSQWTTQIDEQVLTFANTLSELRFAALSPFADLMTDGSRVYQVDFGEDLGDPYTEVITRDFVKLAREWLARCKGKAND
jgi:hypothetical protein